MTLHLPLTDETRGSIGADAFAKMRDGVRIVNAARGELVDEDALLEALAVGQGRRRQRSTSSRREPYSGPLLGLDNVVATPHLAASTEEAQDRAGVIVAEQIVARSRAALVTNAVNIPTLRAEDIEALAPYVPLAAKLGRLAMELAQGRAERIELTYYGALARVRHAAAHGRGAERRVPGPHRPAGELRERAARRRRARDRGRARSGARSSRDFTNLIASVGVDGRSASPGRRSGASTGTWLVSALGFELEMELAPLIVVSATTTCPA